MRKIAGKVLSRVRLRLEQEQAGKLRKVEVLARSRASMTCPPEPRCGDEADQAIVSITEQLEHLELRRIATSVHTIEAALLLMEQGRYGQCLRCERPIPPRRLQAVPTAILCRTCQESVEEARAACRV